MSTRTNNVLLIAFILLAAFFGWQYHEVNKKLAEIESGYNGVLRTVNHMNDVQSQDHNGVLNILTEHTYEYNDNRNAVRAILDELIEINMKLKKLEDGSEDADNKIAELRKLIDFDEHMNNVALWIHTQRIADARDVADNNSAAISEILDDNAETRLRVDEVADYVRMVEAENDMKMCDSTVVRVRDNTPQRGVGTPLWNMKKEVRGLLIEVHNLSCLVIEFADELALLNVKTSIHWDMIQSLKGQESADSSLTTSHTDQIIAQHNQIETLQNQVQALQNVVNELDR